MENKKTINIFRNRTCPLYAYHESVGYVTEVVPVFVKKIEDTYFYKVKPSYENDDKAFWVTENEVYKDPGLLVDIIWKKLYN